MADDRFAEIKSDDEPDEPPPLEPPRPARAVDPPPPLDDGRPARVPPAQTAASKPGGGGASAGAGLKKGFFNAGPKPAKRAAAPAKPAEMETIRPANPLPSDGSPLDARLAGLRLDEVQSALKGASAKLSSSTEWITESLVGQMQADPILRQGLTNPRFSAVMTELQTDPQGAMARHQGDGELQMFILRFMQLMASHMSSLGAAQGGAAQGSGGGGVRVRDDASTAAITPSLSAANRAAEELANKALANPELRAVLEDPEVQRVLQHVQARDVASVEQLMRRPDMVTKLQKLAGAGLLQMSWGAS